jgi:hypothetical protein
MRPPDGANVIELTALALANPGKEYLALDPRETADPCTVTLAAGTYTVQLRIYYNTDVSSL